MSNYPDEILDIYYFPAELVFQRNGSDAGIFGPIRIMNKDGMIDIPWRNYSEDFIDPYEIPGLFHSFLF